MRNLWDHVDGKLGGKVLFDKINGYKLERAIRMAMIACKKFDERISFVLSGRAEEGTCEDYNDFVKLFVYCRHLPPWWGGKMREVLGDALPNRTQPYGLVILVMFSQTPEYENIDKLVKGRHDRVVACKPNLQRCREYLKSQGLKKTDILDKGFQPNNGLVMTTDNRVFTLPRRCYDIIKNSEASPAKEHYEKI